MTILPVEKRVLFAPRGAASTEAHGKQAGRYENLAHLYRQLVVRRRPHPRDVIP
jgi:hypothetical protein